MPASRRDFGAFRLPREPVPQESVKAHEQDLASRSARAPGVLEGQECLARPGGPLEQAAGIGRKLVESIVLLCGEAQQPVFGPAQRGGLCDHQVEAGPKVARRSPLR